jgi:hypothetical protein
MPQNKNYVVGVETLFLLFMILVSLWMFVLALDFSWETSFYPLSTTGMLLLLISLLLVKRLMPNSLIEKLSSDQEDISYGNVDTDGENSMNEKEVSVVALQFGIFVIAGYILGFLLATIIYIYGVLYYYGYGSTIMKLVVTAVVSAITYIGYLVLRIPLTFGQLWEIVLT